MWIFSITSMLSHSTRPSLPDSFLCALSFLTRLGPAREFPSVSFASVIPWFGLTGLITGLVCALPPFLLFIGLHGQFPDVLPLTALGCGLFWLSLEVWLSRCLHWDGVADLADALGASRARFREVLKDSRIGAFGAIAMTLLILAQIVAASLHFAFLATDSSSGLASICGLILAPAWARIAPVWLARGSTPHAPASLGALLCDNAGTGQWGWAWAQGAICLLLCLVAGVNWLFLVCLLVGQIALDAWLRRMGKKLGGLSGDFFGIQIEISQLIFLMFSIG